ncbi:MAG: sugar nucleotide-binding protein, partial [Oleibacter sp.]|nr:sugar nucleotide-binding protein [Thalassolituus sp.]
LSKLLADQNLMYKNVGFGSRERTMLQSSSRPVYVIAPCHKNVSDFAEAEFWLHRAREEDAAVILMSSLMVFKRDTQKRVNVNCQNFSDSEMAENFLHLEQLARQNSQHIILRTGDVFSLMADDFALDIIHIIRNEHRLILNDSKLFEPTPADDVAVVVLAIIRQTQCSDALWGTYHFSGVEAVSAYHFAEALLSEAGQYEDLSDTILEASDVNTSHGSSSDAVIADVEFPEGLLTESSLPEILCPMTEHEHLFHTFGIKSKAWRQGMSRLLRRYYSVEK